MATSTFQDLESKQKRIAFLSAQVIAANKAYHNGDEPLFEDAVYDEFKDELRELNPSDPALELVGADVPEGVAAIPHAIPMGSQDKARNKEEFEKWAAKYPGVCFSASLKMDGSSASLEYDVSKLVRGLTRGNGATGADITQNALHFRQCPNEGVQIAGAPFTGYIRGEVELLNEDWKKLDPDMLKNPRNAGNGLMVRKDSEQADLLSVFAFRAYHKDGREIAETETEMLRLLVEAGFTVAPNRTGTAAEVWQFFEEMTQIRHELPFWTDGVVVKIDHIPTQNALGVASGCPRGQIAIKFPVTSVETVLREVELTVGHTGAIIPTAKFDPIQIEGTTVSSALLCNWKIIQSLGIAVGDSIDVIKSGGIIPKIKKVAAKGEGRVTIPEPTSCPVCGGPVGRKVNIHGEQSVAIYCLNEDCPAKRVGKINRYLRSLEILGMGAGYLEALTNGDAATDDRTAFGNEPLLKTPADLYLLKDKAAELASVRAGEKKIRIGELRAEKIIAGIEAKRELSLADFLGSLGIDGLGKRRVELIQAAVPGELDTLADWLADKLSIPSLAILAKVPNIGPVLSKAVVAKKNLIETFLANGVVLKATARKVVVAGAKTVCFTGKSSLPRAQLKSIAEEKGLVVKDDVSRGLDYLVMADPASTSSKAKKARDWGTKCISEEEFQNL